MDAAAAMVDLSTLSRRELQALCKLNGVRANMTNVAMVQALHSLYLSRTLPEVGTTLCLPTPAGKTAAASDQQQQQQVGRPLPRGRRVSAKSPPEAIRRETTKGDPIVRTPGSTSRRAPAPLPTPAAGTLRRSQRSQAATKVTELCGRAGVASSAENPCVASDEGKATELPEQGNCKADDEPEQQGEEGAAIVEEQKLVNAEISASLSAMEGGSPILGVLSKATPEPAMKNVQDAEINSAIEDKEVEAIQVPQEAIKEDALNSTVEAAAAPNNMVPAAVTEKEVAVDEKYGLVGESSEEAGLTDDLEDMLKVDRTVDEESDETIESAAAPNIMVPAAVTEKEVSAADLLQADLTESAEEYDLDGESTEEAELTEESTKVTGEDEEDILSADRTVDEESDYTIDVSGSIGVNFESDGEEGQRKMLETAEETKEYEESDSLTGEEDDCSGDLSSELDDNLLWEILLRLPPLPSSLPRASAVSKRWRSIASDPGFCSRFRRHHRRNPPLLGFFDQNESQSLLSFVPTIDAPNRVPPLLFSVYNDPYRYVPQGSRHGLVLVIDKKYFHVLVWDPVTGDQHRADIPLEVQEFCNLSGSVLRDAGDVHFRVILAGRDDEDQRALARLYSSETGLWSDLISGPLPPGTSHMPCVPAVLVGDSLYWQLDGRSLSGILEFNFERQSLVVIPMPVDTDRYRLSVIQEEGGGLGFLFVSYFTAQLWKMETDRDGIESWVLGRTIELDKLLSLNPDEHEHIWIEGYAEENNVVFLETVIDLVMLQLPSLKFKIIRKTSEYIKSYRCHPFESIYTAEERQVKMVEAGEETEEYEERDSLPVTGEEEDDCSGDLSSDLASLSDAETESGNSPVALEGASSAAKTVESVITEEINVSSSEEGVVSQHVETIVKSLDEVAVTQEKKEECAKERRKQMKVGTGVSLESAYKESQLIAAKEGKKLTITTNQGSRMALAELDKNNAEC